MFRKVHVGRRALLAGALIPAFVLFIACGGKGTSQTVRVVLQEWSVRPGVASVPAGNVTFDVVNQGTVEHELVILKTDLGPTALKMLATESKVDETASGQDAGDVDNIVAGTTKSMTFDLVAGQYVLLCNIVDHYRQGMVTAFDVK